MADKLAIDGGTPIRTEPWPSWPIFGEEEEQRLIQSLRSGQWGKITGEQVRTFERKFADYHEAKNAVAVVNGTVALRIALLAAGIEAGDEVIVPPFTFLATASAVVECNAVPIFADIQLDTFNIDPSAIEELITERTKAIIVVHLGGLPADMDTIMDLANRHNLVVIEDAAHAHGASYKNRKVGSIGHLSTFSFQSSKNLNSGEGGIILTNDDELAGKCWQIHNCGRLPHRAWYEHFSLGGNYRLSEFQGAVLHGQWSRFEEQAQTREQNGKYLAERMAAIPGITPQLRTDDCTRHAYHLFSFRYDQMVFDRSRDDFLKTLTAEGVPAAAAYPVPLYAQPMFENLEFGPYTAYRETHPELNYAESNCPNCELISYREGVWLEHRLMLGTQDDMDDIVAAIEKIHANR